MAEAQKLNVRARTVLGKKVSGLRRQGVLPGVVFGGRADSTPVETDLHAFELSYRRWGETTLLSLTGLDGGEVPALIHDVTRDPVTGRMLHVDFARVSLTEKTNAEVPLHFIKESPAVRTLGAVLLHALSEVTVEAFPQDIPRSIEVDLSGLNEIDDAIYVRDLKVDATLIRIENDPDELVVKAVPVKVEEEKPAEAAAPAEGEAAAEGEEGEAAPAAPGAEGAKPAAAAEGAKGGAAPKAPAAGAPKKP
ncbi:MAG TPA: 50S ribosomal protein L25 [Candidatus Limnocylindria bacterium]